MFYLRHLKPHAFLEFIDSIYFCTLYFPIVSIKRTHAIWLYLDLIWLIFFDQPNNLDKFCSSCFQPMQYCLRRPTCYSPTSILFGKAQYRHVWPFRKKGASSEKRTFLTKIGSTIFSIIVSQNWMRLSKLSFRSCNKTTLQGYIFFLF